MRGTLGIHPPQPEERALGAFGFAKGFERSCAVRRLSRGDESLSRIAINHLAARPRTWSADSIDVTEEYRSVILVSLPRRDKELFSLSAKCCVFRATRLLQTDCFSSSRKDFSIVLMLEGFSGVWRDKCHAPSAC